MIYVVESDRLNRLDSSTSCQTPVSPCALLSSREQFKCSLSTVNHCARKVNCNNDKHPNYPVVTDFLSRFKAPCGSTASCAKHIKVPQVSSLELGVETTSLTVKEIYSLIEANIANGYISLH